MGGGPFDGFDAVNLGYGRATPQSRLGLDSFEAQKRRRIRRLAPLRCAGCRVHEAGEGAWARGWIFECDGAEACGGLVGGEGAGE